ncbi:MAG: aminotransferase class V-fold PLP-dependent enzyme [Eubacteriales bacterium]
MSTKTPLYDAINNISKQNTLRLHMPGHKGKPIPFLEEISTLDFTEIEGTGNLYEKGEPFERAQQMWAEKFGFDNAQLLTAGSTQGVYTALALCKGDQILLDRNCHRSAFHAMGFLDRNPVYLQRDWVDGWEVVGQITPEEVEKSLLEYPKIRTVCITSPTYYGVLSDIQKISDVVHKYGGKLVVDGAHGAHLPWVGVDHFRGADLVAISAHKTLPALGQSAVLLYTGFEDHVVGHTASLFGSSSPSYPILISMDLARSYLEESGGEKYKNNAINVDKLRKKYHSIDGTNLDPTRLTLLHPQAQEVAFALEKVGIHLEMVTKNHLVAIFTSEDSDEDFHRFEEGIAPYFTTEQEIIPSYKPPSDLPKRVISIRKGLFSENITLPLEQTLGKVLASSLAPYPPGVPVVAIGEIVTQKALDYLEKIGYTNQQVLVVK